MSRNRDYQEWLLKELKNADMALTHFTAAFKES